MAEQIDPLILVLTGQLPFVLMTSAVLALPASWLLLRWYRKAVVRTMSRRVSSAVDLNEAAAAPVSHGNVPCKLKLEYIAAAQKPPASELNLLLLTQRLTRQAAAVYGTAGLLFALVLALAYLTAGGIDFVATQLVMMWFLYLWPVVLVINIITTASRASALLNVALYFVLFSTIDVVAVMRNPGMEFSMLFVAWFTYNLLPTVLMLAFLNRRVRAVGPMVLTFMVAAVIGALVTLAITQASDPLLRLFATIGVALGLSATVMFLAIALLGFILFGIGGWFVLKIVRNAYVAGKLSDQSMTLDSIILLFAISYSVSLAFAGAAWVLTGLLAFVVYKLLVRAGFNFLSSRQQNGWPAKRLLVLRVFSLGKMSEQLFNAIAHRWRYLGSVQLIAGPDLATTTVEPHEFLSFLSGRLDSQFIADRQALNQQLTCLQYQPDFDSRYRINDLFCYADTWKHALSALVEKSDVVLMDLRSFSAQKSGCIHEINTLINIVPLQQIVLVVDGTTDLTFLEQTLQNAWHQPTTSAYDKSCTAEKIKVFKLDTADAGATTLMPWLCASAN